MKKWIFILLFTVLVAPVCRSQPLLTANSFIPDHKSQFAYGINPGWYSTAWDDKLLAEIALKAGVHTSRLSLPDDFLENNGYEARTKEFTGYVEGLKFKDLTVFIGSPSKAHQATETYPGCTEPSHAFKGIYEPPWKKDNRGKQVINADNALALYIYNVYAHYGRYISYWEVWNEPDFTYNWSAASVQNQRASWWNQPPAPRDLPNLQCPVYAYIRMLRVTYEVVKKLNPRQLVTTGGIGYESFLHQILQNTDNPMHGEVTAAYPLKGGAYFDVLSFHDYPFYYLSSWNNFLSGKTYFRHSDAAADEFIQKKRKYEDLLFKNGYDGKIFPRKYMICTEINIPAKQYPDSDNIGSEKAQRNFTIKSLIAAQQTELRQMYYFVLGRNTDEKASTDPYQLMGLYDNLTKALPGHERLTSQGVAFKTTSSILYGYTYNQALTKEMKLGNGIAGAAFLKNKEPVFVLWAKTSKDLCECAHAVYKADLLRKYKANFRHEWDFSSTKKQKTDTSTEIKLTDSPIFYTTK